MAFISHLLAAFCTQNFAYVSAESQQIYKHTLIQTYTRFSEKDFSKLGACLQPALGTPGLKIIYYIPTIKLNNYQG